MLDLFFRLFQKKTLDTSLLQCSCHKISLLWMDSQCAVIGTYFLILCNTFTINAGKLLLCILIIAQALAKS